MQPNGISTDMLARIRALALEQVQLKDELQAALEAGDTPRVVEVARQICGLEEEIKRQ